MLCYVAERKETRSMSTLYSGVDNGTHLVRKERNNNKNRHVDRQLNCFEKQTE